MKEELLNHLNDPNHLEKMYRQNKVDFKQTFNSMYPELKGNLLAKCWYERLNYETQQIHRDTSRELWFVLIVSVLAGLLAKLPTFFSLEQEFFYSRNMGFIIFPALSAYFAWQHQLSAGKITAMTGTILISLFYINSLPDLQKSDTTILACIHLVLFLWSVMGFSYISKKPGSQSLRLGFLKYNGDLLVMSTLFLIAGGIMSGITIVLFGLIGWHIEDFYFEHIVIFGLPAVPIMGTYFIQTNPQLVGKISPLIAKLFSPLVLVMLVIYLLAMTYSGQDPYNDREFLLIFNLLLVGVMAIIFFALAESSHSTKTPNQLWILFLLALVTIIVNGIALSAIVFRISEWGITPNRTAVLGANILILLNLILVAIQLIRVLLKKGSLDGVEKVIARYIPLYAIWTAIVTFLFPWLFGFH
ncbi:MAG: hypothetical protein ACNS62_18405 [Candidatus Cyclobacteriaceae bacterium M3_2C_046]